MNLHLLPSNAFSIKAKSFLTALFMAVITAAVASLGQALGLNDDGTISAPHLPTKIELVKALYVGLGAGVAYIIRKFFKNDVPAAAKTIEEAQEKAKEEKQEDNSIK